VADHCAERIPEEMVKEVKKTSGDLCTSIETVFLKVLKPHIKILYRLITN